MTAEEIDDILNGKSNEVLEACAEIASLQKREIASIKTGISDVDHFLITGLNNMMVFIGARPSMGKTHMANVVKDNLLDKELNPNIDIALLHLNWEMQTKSSVLRHMKRKLGRSMRDILSREFTEEEKVDVKEIMKPLFDDRVLNFNHIIEGEAFEYLVESYIAKNEGKEVVVLIDHIHILLTKNQIDEFLFSCNKLKKKYTNLSFIIFFQLNRELERRWRGGADAKMKLNPKNFVPNSGDIYNSDSLYQFGDLIMTMVIPQVVDLDEYTTINKNRNKHLEPHFIDNSGDNKTAKLKGRNRIYRNYIKIRLNDNFEDPRIYCEILDPTVEDEVNQTYYSDYIEAKVKPTFPKEDTKKEIPTVDFVNNDLSNSSAVGKGFEDNKSDKPF
jgi:replicative DNA helicase